MVVNAQIAPRNPCFQQNAQRLWLFTFVVALTCGFPKAVFVGPKYGFRVNVLKGTSSISFRAVIKPYFEFLIRKFKTHKTLRRFGLFTFGHKMKTIDATKLL
jgi:hypothetical protein